MKQIKDIYVDARTYELILEQIKLNGVCRIETKVVKPEKREKFFKRFTFTI